MPNARESVPCCRVGVAGWVVEGWEGLYRVNLVDSSRSESAVRGKSKTQATRPPLPRPARPWVASPVQVERQAESETVMLRFLRPLSGRRVSLGM